MEKAISQLQSWTSSHHLPWPENAASQFQGYIQLLIRAQQQTNLTGFSTPQDLVQNLFIDSLQILRTGCFYSPESISLIDVGTGAGFPAIPIKILLPNINITLVEPRTKRYAFLRLVERSLNLSNISIFKSKIESVHLDHTPTIAISKAFAPLPEWLQITKPWALSGSRIACLVSQSDWDAFDLKSSGFTVHSIIAENDRIYAVLTI